MDDTQSVITSDDYVQGVFKSEIKNRFLCQVNVAGDDVVCYIPSSCRLSNFLDLTNRNVLLKPVKDKNAKTKYSVYAVEFEKNYILLNLSQSNRIIENQINRRYFSFLGNINEANTDTVIKPKIIDNDQIIGTWPSKTLFNQTIFKPTKINARAKPYFNKWNLSTTFANRK